MNNYNYKFKVGQRIICKKSKGIITHVSHQKTERYINNELIEDSIDERYKILFDDGGRKWVSVDELELISEEIVNIIPRYENIQTLSDAINFLGESDIVCQEYLTYNIIPSINKLNNVYFILEVIIKAINKIDFINNNGNDKDSYSICLVNSNNILGLDIVKNNGTFFSSKKLNFRTYSGAEYCVDRFSEYFIEYLNSTSFV